VENSALRLDLPSAFQLQFCGLVVGYTVADKKGKRWGRGGLLLPYLKEVPEPP